MTSQANRRRANDARDTLNHTTIMADGLDVAIIDQLANLMHLCTINNLDFDVLADVADGHFKTETKQ